MAAKKKGMGRPRLEFDLDLVERLAGLQCTNDELAAALGCSRDTVQDRIANDPDFSYRLEKGRGHGRISLRRLQWKAAQNGNTGMMVWLGKQWLAQQDKMAVQHTETLKPVRVPARDTPQEWTAEYGEAIEGETDTADLVH